MLSKFPNVTLKVGAKVSLSPQSDFASDYSGSTNPIGIVGEVTGINCCEFEQPNDGLEVTWSNNTWNHYRNSDYDLIAEGEPGYLEV